MIYANGESAIPFIGNNCALKMMRYICKKSEDGDKIRLFFHNLSYDFNFFSEIVYLSGKCIKIGASIATADGRFTYMGKTISVTFQDTYKMVPSKLADFGKMFGLGVKKEVIYHGMYTEENIGKRYMSVEECGVYMGDRFDEFMANAMGWGLLRNGGVDIIGYSSRYCMMDCVVLRDGYLRFCSLMENVTGLNAMKYLTLASISHDHLVKSRCYEGVWKLCGTPRKYVQKCIVGGRTTVDSL